MGIGRMIQCEPRAKIRQDCYFSVWDVLEFIFLHHSSGPKSSWQVAHTGVHGSEEEEGVFR